MEMDVKENMKLNKVLATTTSTPPYGRRARGGADPLKAQYKSKAARQMVAAPDMKIRPVGRKLVASFPRGSAHMKPPLANSSTREGFW